MTTVLVLAYAASVLTFWSHSLYRLAAARRPAGSRMEASDYIVLTGVALLSSAAWPLLAPVYGAGWLHSRRARLHRRPVLRVTRGGGALSVASLSGR